MQLYGDGWITGRERSIVDEESVPILFWQGILDRLEALGRDRWIDRTGLFTFLLVGACPVSDGA